MEEHILGGTNSWRNKSLNKRLPGQFNGFLIKSTDKSLLCHWLCLLFGCDLFGCNLFGVWLQYVWLQYVWCLITVVVSMYMYVLLLLLLLREGQPPWGPFPYLQFLIPFTDVPLSIRKDLRPPESRKFGNSMKYGLKSYLLVVNSEFRV